MRAPEVDAAAEAEADVRTVRRSGGWRIVARKEVADHFRSARFAILLVIMALAGLAAVNSAASEIRDAAQTASGTPSVFLLLFTVSPDRIPSFFELVGFLGPLLGIAFGFDAINSERAGGTLPRLVSQPIHRDDVITGKFVAGLTVIALALASLAAIVTGYGIARLGITPDAGEAARLAAFVVLAIVYVGVWLALAVLLSVLVHRAATSVLACIAAWLVLTMFAALITGFIADAVVPLDDEPTVEATLDNDRWERGLSRLSPERLYEEAAEVLLNPQIRSLGILLPEQVDQAVPDALPFDQSLLLVWPQVTAVVGITVVLFTIAYIAFMRQEIRA
jgi:ABC-2 type transport system permease protein